MPAQADMHTPSDIPPKPATHGQRDAPAMGDYEVVAKRTRLVSSRDSTRPAKKSRRSLITELAK